jgi:nitrile hydratase beta subunit
MNGAHDMGGMQGMGPVVAEADEPVFHADWEARMLAMFYAMGAWGRWNIDMGRFARENVPAVEYLSRSYYQIWLHALERLLVEKDLVSRAEIDAANAGDHAARTAEPPLKAGQVAGVLARGSTARVDATVAPAFAVGDAVRALNRHPRGHTRAPRYVRGRTGTVVRDHGVFIFPDTHAVDGTKKPQHVYAVRFSARELWGPEASPHDSVMVDLWDDYLEPAA